MEAQQGAQPAKEKQSKGRKRSGRIECHGARRTAMKRKLPRVAAGLRGA